jgi:hypothetical protein
MCTVLTEILNKDVIGLINNYLMISEDEVKANHHRAMNQLRFHFGLRKFNHYMNSIHPFVYKITHYSSKRRRIRVEESSNSIQLSLKISI